MSSSLSTLDNADSLQQYITLKVSLNFIVTNVEINKLSPHSIQRENETQMYDKRKKNYDYLERQTFQHSCHISFAWSKMAIFKSLQFKWNKSLSNMNITTFPCNQSPVQGCARNGTSLNQLKASRGRTLFYQRNIRPCTNLIHCGQMLFPTQYIKYHIICGSLNGMLKLVLARL